MDGCRVGPEFELIESRIRVLDEPSRLKEKFSARSRPVGIRSGRSRVWVRTRQDSSTTRADPEREEPSKGRIRTGPGLGAEQRHAKQGRPVSAALCTGSASAGLRERVQHSYSTATEQSRVYHQRPFFNNA